MTLKLDTGSDVFNGDKMSAARADPEPVKFGAQRKRIVYLQYSNPAHYPPLEHSSHILADDGWNVTFIGSRKPSVDTIEFEPHPMISVQRVSQGSAGWRQKAHYAAYFGRVLAASMQLRPDWVYASDPLSCPVALAVKRATGAAVVYHEHDSPGPGEPKNAFMRTIMAARRTLARQADICVLPQDSRLEFFRSETGRTGPTICVWNCPRRTEVGGPKPDPSGPLRLYYHGSLNPQRLPTSILHALAAGSSSACLTIVGYETQGHVGFVDEFLKLSRELNLGDRVRHLGELSRRRACLETSSASDIGLALMPASTEDINMLNMAGASNKPFDYMAQGLAVVVSDLPEWRRMFVENGFARACGQSDASEFTEFIRWCEGNRSSVRAMGERGRQQILRTWNYENLFSPVAQMLAA